MSKYHDAYVVVYKGKITIPVGREHDAVAGIDKIFPNAIIPPAYRKGFFSLCRPGSSSLSCDIANAIASTLSFVYSSGARIKHKC